MSAALVLPQTNAGYSALVRLDESFIGTPDYMGLAYFWAYEYRHFLRDASPVRRVRAHRWLLRAGLALDGESEQHRAIIERAVRVPVSAQKEAA